MQVTMKIKDSTDLRKRIANDGYSIRKFSDHINVSGPYLSQVINEKRKPSPHTAWKIARGLKVDISDIFFIDYDDKSETKSDNKNESISTS